MKVRVTAAVVLLSVWLLPNSVQALKISGEAERFVAGATVHTIHHEIAHMLIDRFQLPVVGREEDAADQYAWLRMLDDWRRTGDDQPLRSAIRLWQLEHLAARKSGDLVPAWSEHSSDRQRLFMGICMVAGSEPEAFGDLADLYRMPADRIEACEDDALFIADAWDELLELADSEGEETLRLIIEDYDSKSRGGSGGEGNLRILAAWMLRKDTIPARQIVDEVNQRVGFHEPMTLRFRNCEEADAHYDPVSLEVVICYEEIDTYMDLLQDR
jgi:hypothetical protein